MLNAMLKQRYDGVMRGLNSPTQASD